MAGATPLVDGSPTTSGQTFLYRWSVGDRSATRVANQILVASWAAESDLVLRTRVVVSPYAGYATERNVMTAQSVPGSPF